MYASVVRHKRIIFKDHYLLYLSFLFLGFNKVYLYLPLLALFYFLKLPIILNIRINKKFTILLFLMLLSVLPLMTVGLNNLTIENPIIVLSVLFISIVLAGFALQYQNQHVKYIAIMLYILGVGVESLIIAGYSFLTDPILYGYGKVLNPFSGDEMNSPGTSNNLAILAILLLYLIFFLDNYLIKLFAIALVAITFAGAIFLGGRTFFVIVFIGIFLLAFSNLKIKNIAKILFYIMLATVVLILVITQIEELQLYLEFTLNRFDNGLESNRFGHYAHGLSQILYYPFGGFTVDKSFEDTSWFHNVFLDNARIAGWLPVLALILGMGFIGLTIFKYKDEYYRFGFVVFVITFLIMQQDVVIEGNIRTLVLMYFSGILLLSSKRIIGSGYRDGRNDFKHR